MTSTDPFADLYRPDGLFRSEELQIMAKEGSLRHVLADVYAASGRPNTAALRARALRLLLAQTESPGVALCGETAAWIHLGAPHPERLTLCAEGFLRHRPSLDLQRQIHQVTLLDAEITAVDHLPVTTVLRTAVDLFLGIGTVGSRGAVDKAARQQAFYRTEVSYWPRRTPSWSPDEHVEALQDADVAAWTRRIGTLGQLITALESRGTVRERIAEEIMAVRSRTFHRSRATDEHRERIIEALDHSASRRLPTVLYTS